MPPNPKKARPALNLDQFFQPATGGDDLDFLLGVPEETAQRAQVRGLPLRNLPVHAIAPDADQVRRLALPHVLLELETAGDKATTTLLGSLRELGESIRAHGQLQPAIVYPYADPQDPELTHRILHGQRRWTAAVLVDLPTLWVVEIDRPGDVDRLLRQVEENERRAGLVDMERAWALVSLRDALRNELNQEVPWSIVEAKLQISEGRRHDLLRLLRFPPEAQNIILRYGWAEWTLRPLHQALSAGTLELATATDMLLVLADMPEVTAPVVSTLVATYLQEQHATARTDRETEPPGSATSDPDPNPPPPMDTGASDAISQRIVRLRQNVDRLQAQMTREQNLKKRASWKDELIRLQESLNTLLAALDDE